MDPVVHHVTPTGDATDPIRGLAEVVRERAERRDAAVIGQVLTVASGAQAIAELTRGGRR